MALTRPRYSQIPDSDYKNSCRIVTTTNVTLTSGAPQTYDGITLVQYDRVLVTGQTDKTQNGIYSVSTLGSGSNGTWVRSKDANANDRLTAGMNTFVEEGTYTGQFWHLLTPGPIVLGVSELIFGQLSGNTTITSGFVIGNLVIGGNIVSNSGNVSNSTTTGALVLTGQGGAGIGGNVNVGGNVSADKFYTTNGLFWAANGLAFSSGLEVSEINTANTVLSNISTQVTSLRFDRDTGFSVTELDPGNVKISLGSSFKTWHVPGQADLVAAAEDEVTFFGNGIDITTNPTFPKSITFIANNSVLEANISAYQLYANANAAAQAVSIDTINSNIIAANAAIQTLSANIGTLVGGASAALDTLLELGNALGNSDSFSSTVVNWLSNISANVTAANAAITTLDANVGTLFLGNASTNANLGAYQLYANANIGSIYNQLNTLDANVGTYQLYANANLASIQTQITSITTDANANIASYLTTYTGNIAAGNIIATGNITASYITTQGVDSGNISGVNYIYANNFVYSANGVSILAAHDANIGTLFLGNTSTQANIGAFYNYANANIGTLFLGNASTNANLGAYQTYVNTSIATLDANVGTLFLGNASTNANLGAYQLYANANIGSIYNQLNALDANVGAFQTYANANIGTLFLGNASTNANLGAYQTWANLEIGFAFAEIGDLDTKFDINAASQATALDNINANIGSFYTYANSKIGTNNNSNLVIQSTQDSVSAITGALVVKGGVGVGGNLYVTGNIYAANLTAISISTLSVQDPLLYLTADTPFPYNYDIGFFSHYSTTSGFEQHTGIARDYTNGIWGFFSNLSANPGATVDWTEANLIYDAVRVGDLIASNTTPSTSTTTGALRVAGGAGIEGALYITNTGDVSANIGTLFLGNLSTQANLGEFQIYSNAAFATLDANIGTISTTVNDLASTLGSYTSYANVYLGVSKTFTVTNVTSSEYIIDGTGGNPALYLIRGQKYNFSINASSHVFWIKTAPSTGTGDQYNTGVVNNGTDSGLITFDVSLTAPDVLYYASQYDATMNGTLYVVDFSNIDANIGTLFLGNAGTQANLGAFQTYSNTRFTTLDANIGTLFLGNAGIQANLGAFQTYSNTRFTTLDANIGTLFLGNAGTQANLGAFQTYANTTFTTYSNANAAAYLPIYSGNISAGNIDVTGKTVADKFYTTNGIYWSGNGVSYSTGGGGGGITYTAATTPPVGPAVGDQWYDTAEGILYEYMDDGDTNQWVDIVSPTFSGANPLAFNSNVTVTGNILIGDGIFWSVNGAPYSTGGGGGSFSGSDDVLRANVGAYQIYANANIGTLHLGNISINSNLGAYQTWANSRIQVLDANIGTLFLDNVSTQANLGAFQIYANANIGTIKTDLQTLNANLGAFQIYANANIGTLFLGNSSTNANLGAYQTWANANFGTGTYSNTNVAAYLSSGTLTTGANIVGDVTITGNLTGSLGFMLEKTNIVPSSPPTISDIDILTCPIVYYTGNATSNITANLRGNSTVPLNDIVANGQAVTFSLFVPQSTAYYVNQINIDNIPVPSANVSWQGYVPVSSGNANSIDLYAFTAIKGSINNWRVFATQTTYTHTGLWTNYRSVQFAAEYIVVAGGGSGGTSYGGGGGAGGLRYGTVPIAGQQAYTVTVGGGGAATLVTSTNGSVGTSSTFSGPTFSTVTAAGGGSGSAQGAVGGNGGSGGGGGSNGPRAGGISSPVTSPVQGYAGGSGIGTSGVRGAGGGGGAGGVGSTGSSVAGGAGGVGTNAYSTWATATSSGLGGYYAGGGGGGAISGTNVGGAGGSGGGGGGGSGNNNSGTAGSTNTGGGGGGMGDRPASGSSGAGGSGIVLIRYADTYPAAASTTGSPTLYTSGGYRYYKFTGDGSITW
jgi:hypothetical protein